MKSIDVVNSVRVYTSIPVANASRKEVVIGVKSNVLSSDPTILSSLEKNARLVFYSSIQQTAPKTPSTRIKRTRTNKTKTTKPESLDNRISKLLQNSTDTNEDINSDLRMLPLFNQSPENNVKTGMDKVRSTATQQVKDFSHQAGDFVSKSTGEISFKTEYIRSNMTKFVKTIDRKLNNS